MNFKNTIAALTAALLLLMVGGCSEKNSPDKSDIQESTVSQDSSQSRNEKEKLETTDTPEIPEPDPYDYPYNMDEVRNDLIEYGESLGLYFDEDVTMKNATSIVNNQTKAAVNGKALKNWCRQDIDSIVNIAHYQNVELDRIGFNIIIYDSPNYAGEYIIGIYSETD